MDKLSLFLIGVFVGLIIAAVFFLKKILVLREEIVRLNTEKESYIANNNKNYISEFENIANKLLKQNSEDFSKIGQKELNNLLIPLKEKLSVFESKIEKNFVEEAKQIASLETQIKLLSENNKLISQEAQNLTNALKGQSKTRGDWGEFILKRILELSGLKEDIHFSAQKSFKAEEGKINRPDILVNLPEGRHVIVDSKLSLISYEKYHNSETNKDVYFKEFINSVKSHINDLGRKHYQDICDVVTPDFVLMFLPLESCYTSLFSNYSDIIDYAWKHRVIIVGPSTMLATLKSIELFWQKEKQNQNVVEIVKESGKLYDKFVNLLCDIETLRNYFFKTNTCFESIFKKLEGKGNLIRQVEKIKELGAATSKSIPHAYISDEN